MSLLPISGFRWARGFLLVQINGWGTCLEIHFHRGPNALVGERGSGRAAVFDALKLVLQDAADEITWSFYRANQATS
jgi:predicted ATP-dependent endonuclease of OLD family